jgi:hypothetical protein
VLAPRTGRARRTGCAMPASSSDQPFSELRIASYFGERCVTICMRVGFSQTKNGLPSFCALLKYRRGKDHQKTFLDLGSYPTRSLVSRDAMQKFVQPSKRTVFSGQIQRCHSGDHMPHSSASPSYVFTGLGSLQFSTEFTTCRPCTVPGMQGGSNAGIKSRHQGAYVLEWPEGLPAELASRRTAIGPQAAP